MNVSKKFIDKPINMTKSIATVLEAANSAIYIASEAELARAMDEWRKCRYLGLDTEFVRERTYYPNIGLVQVSDGKTVWLVDPLEKETLTILGYFLEDTSITKIAHGASEDLEVLLHAVGSIPKPLIDTQIACALLGHPLQIGFHSAVVHCLGVTIDKDQTRSNWCARPLSREQLEYAALDVCLLPLLWNVLERYLDKSNRVAWLEEDCRRLADRAAQPADSTQTWKRIRGHGRLDGQGLAILKSLAQWRERVAIGSNRPRGFVVPDAVLLNVARNRIVSIPGLESLDDFHPRASRRHGETVTQIVREVIASGEKLDVVEALSVSQRKTLARMRDLVRNIASELGIEAQVLASKRDLESMLQNGQELPDRLNGWRTEILSHGLTRILANF